MIGLGSSAASAGGLLARRFGSARIAGAQLAASGVCCLLAPLMLEAGTCSSRLWLPLWGTTVVGDSPQFSTLTA